MFTFLIMYYGVSVKKHFEDFSCVLPNGFPDDSLNSRMLGSVLRSHFSPNHY